MQEVESRLSRTSTTGRLLTLAGFVVGAVGGAVGYWVVALAGLRSSSQSVAIDAAFFLAIMGFVFGLLAPFALVLYVRSWVDGAVRRDLVTLVAYGVGFLSVAAIGVVGVVVLDDLGVTTAVGGIAVLDAISGFVFGGIAGVEGVGWLLVRA